MSAAPPAGGTATSESIAPARAPSAYAPDHIVEKIRSARGLVEGERKQVTVLFADVKGSMDLASSLEPDAWRSVMERFFELLCKGVHRFEGTVDKFTGDGIMALFGAPLAHEDHARRACYSALHLQDEVARYADELRRTQGLSFSVRMGLNSGDVVVGTIGDDLSLEYTAIGEVVGLAQRMESLAEPGKAYVTDSTAGLVEGYMDLRDLGDFDIKGAAEPVRVHELTGVGRLRTRLDLSAARGFSRFVGRHEELATLEGALERARAGEGEVIGVVADPGVGKSRLCFELTERCRARGIDVWQAHGLAHAQSVPFLPVLEFLRDYFGIDEADDDRVAREKIAGRLLLLDEAFKDALPRVFEFLNVRDRSAPADRMSAEARQRQLFAALNRLLRARSQEAPAVLMLEDLHWIDPGSEAFLTNLVEGVPGTRTLVLTNFRPEYRADWMRRSYYRQLPLSPLGDQAIGELLGELLGSDPSVDGLAELIQERTGGNPFFIEEVVQALADGGELEGERGAYRLVREVGQVRIPASVQSVLAARIDRLSERDKAVLQTAAVVGKTFTEAVLRGVAGLSEADLEAALRELVGAELIYEEAVYPDPEYSFKHPLTAEVAYRFPLSERRAALHGAVARAIVELEPEKHDEHAALVARHFEAAGERLDAARWSARAANWTGFNNPSEALRHWREVLVLTTELPESDETAALSLGARVQILNLAFRLGGDEDELATIFQEGRQLAERSGDVWSLTLLIATYANAQGMTGQLDAYAELATEAGRLAEEAGDEALQMVVSPMEGYSRFVTGRVRESLESCERAVAIGARDPSLGAGVAIVSPYAWAVMFEGLLRGVLGDVRAGFAQLDRALELALEHGDTETRGWAHLQYVNLAGLVGDGELAVEHARSAVEIAERIGDSFSRGWARTTLASAHVAREEWGEALRAAESGLEIHRSSRTGLEGETFGLATLARAQAGLGDVERARETAREAVALARRRGALWSEVAAQQALARVLLLAGGAEERADVEGAVERGLELGRRTGAEAYAWELHAVLADLYAACGEGERAEQELAEARRLLADIGAPKRAEELALSVV